MKEIALPFLFFLTLLATACSKGEDLPEPEYPLKYVYDRYEVGPPKAFRWETGGFKEVAFEDLKYLEDAINDLPKFIEWPIAGVELLSDSTGLIDYRDTAVNEFEMIPFPLPIWKSMKTAYRLLPPMETL